MSDDNDQEQPSDDSQQQPPQAPLPDDVLDGLRNLVEGKADGDKDNALRLLYNDNKNLRDANRQLKEEQPSDDAVVLTGDEAERYQSLEGTEDAAPLEALRKRAEENAGAQERLQELERKETLRTVADAAGITNLDAFKGIANGEVFDVREEETGEEGETVQRAYVAPDEETEAVPLEDYDPFKPYHASLFGGQQPEEQENDSPTFPEQKPGGNPPSDGASKDEISQRKAESGEYRL